MDSRRSITLPTFHYAWVVCGITALVLLVAAGVRTAPQVFVIPFEQEFGWNRADVSLAVAVSILWFGLGAPMSGWLIDRFGLRGVMVGGLLLIMAGLLLMLTMGTLRQLHLYWGAVVGIGTGTLANVIGAVVAQRWFRIHRGLIVGLMGAASAAGQLLFIRSMIALNTWGGWRLAIGSAAAAMAILIVPVLVLIRNRPEEMDLRPYGEERTGQVEADEDERRTELSEALRTREFWLLAASFFVCGYTTNGLIGTHLLSHAIEHGFEAGMAGNAIAVMGVMNIVGTLASGWLSDRCDNRWLLAIYYSFRAISIAMLPFVTNFSGLLIFSIVYGLDWIATVPPTINLTAQRFGRASVGVLYGWIFFAHMAGAAVAAWIGGALHDRLGDYTLAFLSAAVLGFVAAGLSLGVSRVQSLPAAAES